MPIQVPPIEANMRIEFVHSMDDWGVVCQAAELMGLLHVRITRLLVNYSKAGMHVPPVSEGWSVDEVNDEGVIVSFANKFIGIGRVSKCLVPREDILLTDSKLAQMEAAYVADFRSKTTATYSGNCLRPPVMSDVLDRRGIKLEE